MAASPASIKTSVSSPATTFSNTPTGDTLILQAANTTLAPGSGEFENLTRKLDAPSS